MAAVNIAVINEVLRNVSSSNPEALKSMSAEIKELLIARTPEFRDYIAEMETRLVTEDSTVKELTAEQKDEELAKLFETRRKRDLDEVTSKVVKNLEELASGKKHFLDMTVAGVVYGMSQWARELVLLLPQLMNNDVDKISVLGNWLRQDNNLLFLGL